MCCVLPWYSDGGSSVWGVTTLFGFLGVVAAAVAWWRAALWSSPVAVALLLAVGALSALGGLAIGGSYDAVTPFPFVALAAFVVGVVGAMRQAPAK